MLIIICISVAAGVLFGVWRRERGDAKRFHFNSVFDLVQFVKKHDYFRNNTFIYRGQTKPWVLRASLYRNQTQSMEAAERLADWLLNRKRKALVSNIPEVARLLAKGFIDGFEAPINVITNATFELSHIAFAIAQHFGYPTSLLGWTTDLDVAAFFATLGNFDRENGVGVIFALNLRDGVPPDDSLFGLHNSLIGVRKTEFSGIKRIDAQKGLFCIDPNLRTEIAIKMPWFDYITHMTFNHSDRYISHIANDRVIFPSDCKIARLISGYKST